MPGLGTTFGRGGATTAQQDLANADAILIMGSSMAENHPVGFRWVVKARERGATIIHVDPRFTRTSAMADVWAPFRAGTDTVFLGGLVNHVLANGLEFRDYVVPYTNAATIINEDFQDTEDLGGFFSGWDPLAGKYSPETRAYETESSIQGLQHDGGTTLSGGGTIPSAVAQPFRAAVLRDRKKLVWWDAAAREWTGLDTPDFTKDKPPDYAPPPGARGDAALPGDAPFIMHADGVGWIWVASGLKDGPLPAHYEPLESPVGNRVYPQEVNPAADPKRRDDNEYARSPGDDRFPHVLTTYRLTEHHTAGGMSRTLSHLAELQPELFCEISDLGRPDRFLNMLRVVKLRSPMSVGAWTLLAFSNASAAAAFADMARQVTGGRLPVKAIGDAAEALSAATGLVLSTYTGVLIGATAIPVWSHNAHLLPLHFGASGLNCAVAILELLGHRDRALNALGIGAAAVETAMGVALESRSDPALDPVKHGSSGRVTRAGGLLSGPVPLLLRLLGGRSATASRLAAVSTIVGSLLTRVGWVAAGKESAAD